MAYLTNSPPCHFRANAYENACSIPPTPVGAPAGGVSAVHKVYIAVNK